MSGSFDAGLLTAADFLAAIQRDAPHGQAWPTLPGTLLAALHGALADDAAFVTAAAWNFLDVEAYPGTANLLLPDWERIFGLPDPCTPLNPTLAQRQAAVLARMAAQGGQSQNYFAAIAALLGFDATIETYTPSWAGTTVAGDPVQAPDVLFIWTVQVAAGGTGDRGQLECTIQSLAPADTSVTFSYAD